MATSRRNRCVHTASHTSLIAHAYRIISVQKTNNLILMFIHLLSSTMFISLSQALSPMLCVLTVRAR